MNTNPEDQTDPASDGCRRLSDLCRAMGIATRRGARWAQSHQTGDLVIKRRRAGGGSPEWWLTPEGVSAFRQAMGGRPPSIHIVTASLTAPQPRTRPGGRRPWSRLGTWLRTFWRRRGRVARPLR